MQNLQYSNFSRSVPYDDVATYSMEASAAASDSGLIVEETPDPDAATRLAGALRAKFLQQESAGATAPTVEEHEATMVGFERVEAARAKQQGPH